MKFAVGERHHFVGVELLAALVRLLFQCGGYALAAAGELELALVGEHYRFGAPVGADHDGLGVSAGPAESLQQRR